ncbi:MAG: hypothetical protein R2705_07510 [Ilumatobacteraceae bacterium]
MALDSSRERVRRGFGGNNVLRVTAAGAITVIDVSGDGAGTSWAARTGVYAAGNVYVAGYSSDNVFRVSAARW